MDLLFSLCLALSFGIVFGFLFGGAKAMRKPPYTEKQIEAATALRAKVATIVKYLTFFVLTLGLLWCIYFLALGVVDPSQVDYATGMAQLIVSVLTIISIMFAFFEFLKH